MRPRSILKAPSTQCKHFASDRGPRPIPILPDGSLETFTTQAFNPAKPALLPRKHFADLPAIHKWFTKPTPTTPTLLNTPYLSKFGATLVPIEITNEAHFTRIQQSLSFFLECVTASTSHYPTTTPRTSRYFSAYVPGARAIKRTAPPSNDFFSSSAALSTPTARVYLAQAPLCDLPRAVVQDVPTPEVVLKAGKGDVYDSSIWLGQAPTYTPLHRDPNPNLFVQLAGQKRVRLCRAEVGRGIFARVQERIGGNASATMRGEEMMAGEEKRVLEEEVWGGQEDEAESWDAELESGDGLFIPKGWWHSVKGTGEGMTGSVNWWFR
ncbi:hypothetical protein M409DRAFT_16895 [Zasmidium cellare ATCC 36951]|uniref:JmjC domain-containing protein n=1 Tax=Zasmidium cellare ATCC 36951 TaxID=1080233 RepID=A0A6A6D0J4_ZASCE|nr:uncharacterized protein M409DRAFT_16895 [Zasmidium cellare ATCC 36951]KAF2172944.1 hypothetical protein M409DRAFT_16895 [Zasmidium cellare ATCC 36951]